jgi:MFS family permease
MLQAVLAFLLVLQGATGLGVGLTGGLSDAVGHVLKPLFGAVADRTRRRKPLVVGGYVVAALARIGIGLSTAWEGSLLFRSADRVGKGMRAGPRDSLLAEGTPPGQRGRVFGLHRAADTAGAVVGVVLALAGIVLLGLAESAIQRIVLAAALAGLLTLVPLALVREDSRAGGASAAPKAVFEAASPRYRAFLVVSGVFALGQVSYLFYVLRAAGVLGGVAAVALYLLYNVVYAALSYPAGRLSDRWGRARLLAASCVLFAGSATLLAVGAGLALAAASFVLYGAAFALSDGVGRAMAADLAGTAARSTRLGLYQAVIGVAAVLGGVAAGALWDLEGQGAAFAFGAVVPLVALAMLGGMGFLRRQFLNPES